jgi:DNA-binding NtrC family response regulator
MSFRIFIVEDDLWLAQVMMHHLSLNPDFNVTLFTRGDDLLRALHQQPDVVYMDYMLPDTDGERLLGAIKMQNPLLPVIAISAQDEISVAVRLLKQGASDYIVKGPHFNELLWKSVLHVQEHISLQKEVWHLKEELEHKYSFSSTIIGQSDSIKATFNLVQKAIVSVINVSLIGETGTGKEVFAKAIHYNSPRKKAPFVAINMASIPSELAESELFGHERGAFTGAQNSRKGKLEEAIGGTLFLDEVAEMDISLQAKLLRALQEREITRVGGNAIIPVDFRLITATHKNLKEEVAEGRFREDLYYRIIGLPIELPPLRNRENDILILAKYFADEYARLHKIAALKFDSGAKKKLMSHHYPGNIRELKAAIDLACVLCDGQQILSSDINFHEFTKRKTTKDSHWTLKEIEIEAIAMAVQRNNGNVLDAAAELDISKSKIYQYIKMGIVTIQS